jgi:hypothetical protein
MWADSSASQANPSATSIEDTLKKYEGLGAGSQKVGPQRPESLRWPGLQLAKFLSMIRGFAATSVCRRAGLGGELNQPVVVRKNCFRTQIASR